MAKLKIPATTLKFYEAKQIPLIKDKIEDKVQIKYLLSCK
jgi:hypothetical protein